MYNTVPLVHPVRGKRRSCNNDNSNNKMVEVTLFVDVSIDDQPAVHLPLPPR